MPNPEQILDGLGEIANEWQIVAMLWHVYFGALVIGLIAGRRPTKRTAGILLALPLFSVSILAWSFANPFNGTVFALAGLTLTLIAVRLPDERIQIASLGWIVAGGFLFLFGWVYPHFLVTPTFVPYLYAAPTGLVPCPTLSIVIGLALVVGGLESRAWSLVLGLTAAFYGLFGAVRLGVTIDYVLLFGALLIIAVALMPRYRMVHHAPVH